MQHKFIRDPIYGFIEVHPSIRPIVDHALIQRLRWVGQLPLEQLVYPSAQHSRFEHSLGTMALARKAALALHKNNPEVLRTLIDSYSLYEIKEDEKEELFPFCAQIIALLHDVGHAPFSHTLEDATKRMDNSQYFYDHELVGITLAKKILSEINSIPSSYRNIIIRVLNKNCKSQALEPLEALLRSLVDGPIDVDKGDYLLRDNYHCGTVYGVYDHNRLWDNITLSETGKLRLTPKGALEAWSLRLARYKMNENIYFHHVRIITDALLTEIIHKGYKIFKKDQKLNEYIPITSQMSSPSSSDFNNFTYWTDSSLIKVLSNLEDQFITTLIENFTSRKLYKKFSPILLNDYPHMAEDASQILLHKRMSELSDEYRKKTVHFNYVIAKKVEPPILEDAVQRKLIVLEDSKEYSLAKFLGLPAEPEDEESYPTKKMLHLCIEKESSAFFPEIKEKCHSILTELGADELA